MKSLFVTLVMTTVLGIENAQVPADSVGLFAIQNGKATRINKITHTSIKGSGGLTSAVTFGMAKIKSKLEFKGATSEHQFEGKVISINAKDRNTSHAKVRIRTRTKSN